MSTGTVETKRGSIPIYGYIDVRTDKDFKGIVNQVCYYFNKV